MTERITYSERHAEYIKQTRKRTTTDTSNECPTSRTYSVHTLRQSDRQSDEIKHPTVCPTGRTKRLHDTIVGPTSRTDDRTV